MFGELEDSDIYVNNQNEDFEEAFEPQGSPAEETPPEQSVKKSDNKKIFVYIVILAILLIAAVGSYFYKMKSAQQENMIVQGEGQNAQEMGDYFYDKAKGENPQAEGQAAPSDTAVVDVDLTAAPPQEQANTPAQTEAEKKAESPVTAAREQEKKELEKLGKPGVLNNKHVVIPVTSGGRINPFMQFNTSPLLTKAPAFDLIAPPMDIPEEDPLNDTMMATKISGIMYDSQRPSAIINFDGTDHLVHKGDSVKGYKIVDITKDRVVMKYGTNIYRAAVGQQLDDNVKFNEVSNINRQFGGAYAKTPKNIIEIKGN